jgi:hypothetical protein
MRCIACDKRLSDYETTLKHAETGHYLDLCMDCLSEIARQVPMPVKGRKDLIHSMDTQEEVDELTEVEYNKYFKGDREDKDT